jgi:hypothetical protein
MTGPIVNDAAIWFVNALLAYASAGALFAALFVTVGVIQVDPVAQGAGAGFRLVIAPGVVLLWPWLLLRWVGKRRRP